MRETHVTLPELALVAGTRAALGAGVGLLLADRLTPVQRRAVGWTLLAFGAAATIPLAFEILGKDRSSVASLRTQAASGELRTQDDGRQKLRGRPEDRVGYPE
jgi:hypothetical protein